MSSRHPRSKVLLVAEDATGAVLERLQIGFEEYYDGHVPIVDTSAYRAERGIRRLKGEIYGLEGNLMQTFEVEYDAEGEYLHCRAVHEDGTITED